MSQYGRLLSAKQAAEHIGLPLKSLYRLAEESRIACVRTDGRVLQRQVNGQMQRYTKAGRLRFFTADLDQWIARHRVPARSEQVPRPEHEPVAVDETNWRVPNHERRFS